MTLAESLEAREGTEALEGEVFELATLSSFEAFKELMLSYKAQEEGAADGSGLRRGQGLAATPPRPSSATSRRTARSDRIWTTPSP